jgi:uncharacterized surface protein with fasciclin (FAS1) repeats
MSNITQIVNTDKNLKTLKKSVHSDLAFEKLEKGLLEDLMEPQNRPKLADLMSNHIVSGKINFKDLKDGDTLKTVNGKELMVEVKNGNVSIDGAVILARELKISNGVIHSTDTVMMNK